MHMPIYLLDVIYCHVVIALMHITEDALVIHIPSIAILTTYTKITYHSTYYKLNSSKDSKFFSVECTEVRLISKTNYYPLKQQQLVLQKVQTVQVHWEQKT